MKKLKAALGAILMALGGLWSISGCFCTIFAVTGQIETASIGERLFSILAFILYTGIAVQVFRLGARLWSKNHTPKKPKQPPTVQNESEAAEQSVGVKEPKGSEPFLRMRAMAAEMMPALIWDQDIFADYRGWDRRLDSFSNESDAVRFYVLQEGFALEDAVAQYEAYIGWVREQAPWEYQYEGRPGYTHIRVTEAGAAVAGRELLARCAAENIRVVRHEGGVGLYDYATGQRLTAQVVSWPGSVDDAATYGRWTLV